MDVLQLTPEIEVAHLGPSFDKRHLPAVIYFALSAQDSLELNPYNLPAVYLAQHEMRIFSFNLPAHGPDLNALDAMEVWAHQFNEGSDPLSPFIDQVIFALDELISRGLIIREKLGLMGLSRGALIASLVAARYSNVRAIVGFAPMTQLTFAREFEKLQDHKKAKAFNLENHVDALYDKPIRFYIGNRDMRVGTENCFHLVQKLAETAFQKGQRSPPVELIISPSIGHHGHGTSKETFETGADWIGRQLGVIR